MKAKVEALLFSVDIVEKCNEVAGDRGIEKLRLRGGARMGRGIYRDFAEGVESFV